MDPERIPVVAVAAMNDVHLDEVRLLNAVSERLRRCVEEGGGWSEVDVPLARLLEHMEAHFLAEEGRMRTAGFPAYPVHKAAHDQMLALARDTAARWCQHRDAADLGAYLDEDLPHWLLQHIATMDAVTAQYLRARESGAAMAGLSCCVPVAGRGG